MDNLLFEIKNSINELVKITETGIRENRRTPERDSRSNYNNKTNRRYSRDRETERDRNRRQQEGGRYGNKRYGSEDRSKDKRQRRDSGERQKRGSVERQRRGSVERGSSEKDRGQRRYYENKGQNRTRSNSRQKGSPVRLTGCFRCSSDNHETENCTRFVYQHEGPACSHCSYLHNSRFCPKFVRDKKQGGYRREKGGEQENSKELNSEDNLGQKDTTVNNLLPNLPLLFVTEAKNQIQL
jgi:hypothetical protein